LFVKQDLSLNSSLHEEIGPNKKSLIKNGFAGSPLLVALSCIDDIGILAPTAPADAATNKAAILRGFPINFF
jgi:hypothetical protein